MLPKVHFITISIQGFYQEEKSIQDVMVLVMKEISELIELEKCMSKAIMYLVTKPKLFFFPFSNMLLEYPSEAMSEAANEKRKCYTPLHFLLLNNYA